MITFGTVLVFLGGILFLAGIMFLMVPRAKKEKDPILFGIFGKWNENGECILASNRMYVIGDWTDEYCDLTLGRMLTEFAEGKLTPAVGDSVTHPVGEAAESYENFSQDVNNPTAFGSIRVEADDS